MTTPDLTALPGADLVRKGLADLEAGQWSEEAMLVLIGAPRLRRAGIDVPQSDGIAPASPEHALDALLADRCGDAAHGRYNALIRRLVSFERALECVGS